MRAAVLDTPGVAPTFREHPDPVATPGHTSVRVTAAPLVPLDLLCASGTSYFGRPATPYVPGVQGVGVVEDSATLAAGTRVFFATTAGMAPGDGGLAERCVVPDVDVIPMPADLPDPALAALGLSAVAAWMALTWRGRLQEGEHVLVLGAGGAVGQSAVGAARVLGAGRVVAVGRSREAQERARRLGADAVVPLSGDVDSLTARIQDAANGKVDVVVDPTKMLAAHVVLEVLQEQREKVVVGLNASGQVREFQLRTRLNFRLRTGAGKELIPETELLQQRDISFNEAAVFAKEAEEALLYRDMQADLVQQLMRRLAALKTL